MRLPFSLFLAFKYLRPKRNILSVVTLIAVLGVLLGVAALIVVLSVMSGFDDMWRDKILGFNAHVTVVVPPESPDYPRAIAAIEQVPGVRGAGPFIQGLTVLKYYGAMMPAQMIGVDPERERKLTGLGDPEKGYMIHGDFKLEDNQVVLGSELARELRVAIGDEIAVFSPESLAGETEIRLPEDVEVAGIFNVGVMDIDQQFIFCSLDLARDLFGMEEGVHGLRVMVDDPLRVDPVAKRIRNAIPVMYRTLTWQQMNQQLFAVLAVEKNMMFLVLGIVAVVAAFGIMNTLITVTYLKTREIGLLKALGFRDGQVQGVFVWYGFVQGLAGTLLGIGAGLLVLHFRNDMLRFLNETFGLQLFPAEFYHFTTIPARTSLGDVLMISATTLVICGLAAYIPARRAAKLDPVKALRYE